MSKKSDLHSQIHTLHKINATACGLLAVLAAVLMRPLSFPLTLGHLAKDTLASQNGSTVLAPAVHVLFDLQLRYVVVVILAISVLYSLLSITKFHPRYDRDLKLGQGAMRWIYFAITTGLMVEVVGLVTGVSDLFVLKLMGGLIATTSLLGLIAERQNHEAQQPVKSAFFVSLFTAILPPILLTASAIGTLMYGMARNSWYVYGLYTVGLISVALLIVNQGLYYFRRKGNWKDYLFVERNYVVIDFLAKASFGLVLILGLHR